MGADHDGWPVYRVAGEAAEKAGLDALRYCGRRGSDVKCWSQRAMWWGWAGAVGLVSGGKGRNLADGIPGFRLWRLRVPLRHYFHGFRVYSAE